MAMSDAGRKTANPAAEVATSEATIDPGRARCKAEEATPSALRRWRKLLFFYLLATLPLAVTGAHSAAGGVPEPAGAGASPAGAGWIVSLGLHLGALAWVAFLFLRRRSLGEGRLRPLADWTLLLLFPLLYAELPLLMEGLPGPVVLRDGAVQALEVSLFGTQPAWSWAPALPLGWLSELLHLGYLLFYPLIYLPPALLWLGVTGPVARAERREAFHRTVLALGWAMLAAYAVMIVWPVQGPRYLAAPRGVPDGPFRSAALWVLEGGSSRGAAFPSSHVSVAVAQTLLALRWQPRVGALLAVVTPLLAAGAVYGGFHYAVDVIAGAALGVLAAALALRNPPSR